MLEYDGEVLIQHPIDRRREHMRSKIHPVHNRVVLSEMRLISGAVEGRKDKLSRHLREAMKRGLEGLVLKDTQGPYAPGARHWIKLKKDYLQGMADTADLVVLGRFYTFGAAGTGQTFLMGCWDPADSKWKTVCKVGNGLSEAALKRINDELKDSLVEVKNKQRPPWLVCHNSRIPDHVVRDPKVSHCPISQNNNNTTASPSMGDHRIRVHHEQSGAHCRGHFHAAC